MLYRKKYTSTRNNLVCSKNQLNIVTEPFKNADDLGALRRENGVDSALLMWFYLNLRFYDMGFFDR